MVVAASRDFIMALVSSSGLKNDSNLSVSCKTCVAVLDSSAAVEDPGAHLHTYTHIYTHIYSDTYIYIYILLSIAEAQ